MKNKSKFENGYKMTIKTRKEAANRVFSEYIRRSHADYRGFVTCYTCGVQMHWKEADAGHGIGGRGNFVLYLEAVVKPQCSHCNDKNGLSGNYEVFVPKLIDELGREVYDNFVQMSRKSYKIYPHEYLDIELKYKEKLENL